jgi:hypothetical protein
MDEPVAYQIKVQGKLDLVWSDWLDGMTVTTEEEKDGTLITTLTGTVIDQSALLGILLKIGYLNLTLISVNRIEREQSQEGDRSNEYAQN